MKSLIKKIANTKLAVAIRDGFDIRPLIFNTFSLEENYSISDAFIWRTDNSFKTIFKYSDILKLFFKEGNQEVELYFFDKNYELIKQFSADNISLSNQLIIDKKLISHEGYGKFYIFHKNKKKLPFSIINKCYLGFSKNNALPSFVHGNIPSSYQKFDDTNGHKSNIISTSFFMNKKYRIQNYFKDFDRTELFFTNPTSSKIKFSIDKKLFYLKKGCSKIVEIKNTENIEFLSNCHFFRPIIFNYKSRYIDVHHA